MKVLLAILVFFLLLITPAWSIIHFISDDGTDFILVGLGVQELSDVNLEGAVPEDRFKEGFYSQGRVAFYLKGKIKGEYLLELSFDSDKPIMESAKEYIEPEKYYPIYGDTSQLSTEASSQGKLYVMLEKDSSYLLYGRYSTEFNGTEFATYDRILRGTKVYYEGENYNLTLFDVRTTQISVEDEFPEEKETGGICDEEGTKELGSRGPYYLSQTPVVEYTERVTIEVRNKDDLDEVLQSTSQIRDQDYTINYATGRIMFSRFIPRWTSQGNPVFIVVKYEAIPPGKVPTHSIIGGRTTFRPRENIVLGATYVQDARSAEAHIVADFNTEINLGQGLTFSAEYARSSQEKEGNAYQASINYIPSPKLDLTTSFKQVEPDFVDFLDSENDVEEYTFESRFQLSQNFAFSTRFEQEKDNVLRDPEESTATTTTYGAGLEYTGPKLPVIRLGFEIVNDEEKGGDVFAETDSTDQTLSLVLDNKAGRFPYTLEVEMEDSVDNTGYSTDTSELGTTISLPFKIGKSIDACLTHEYKYKKEKETSEGLSRSNKTTLGWQTLTSGRFSLTGTYSFEDFNCLVIQEKTQTHTASLGVEGDLSEKVSAQVGYEMQWVEDEDTSQSNVLSLGLDYLPWQTLKLKASYEIRKDITEYDSTTTYIYDFSGDYTPTLNFIASLSASLEENEDDIAQIFSLSLEGKPYEDITLKGTFSQDSTQDARASKMMTRSTDVVLALAYRPVKFDRFNGLLKGEFKKDEDWMSGSLITSSTILVAGEGIYDVTERFSLFGKYAQKRLSEEGERTTSDMLIIRPGYKLWEKVDIAGECRIFRHIEIKDQEVSCSFEIGYQLTEYLKLIGGYNFQEYQDLRAGENEWRARGPYLRAVAQL